MLVITVMAVAVWVIATFPGVGDELDDFQRASPEAPADFAVTEPVEWVVFIEPSTASQARFRFEIVDADGEEVTLSNRHGFSYSWFGRSGRSIASVELEPGDYRLLVVEGTAAVALGPSPAGQVAWAIGGAVVIGLLFGGAGTAILVVSAIRDTRRRTRNAERPPPSPWSAGEWPS